MTDKEKAIIKNIKRHVSKHYGKWCIKTADVKVAIAQGMYSAKYGKDMWAFQMNPEEKTKAEKVFDNMIEKGLIRYTTQPRAQRDAGGSINYHMNMIVEKKFWDLFNQVKEAKDMMGRYIVLFEDGSIEYLFASDTSEAYEIALDLFPKKISDIWKD